MSNACAANALTRSGHLPAVRRILAQFQDARGREIDRGVRHHEVAAAGLFSQHLGDPGRPLEAHERHPAPHGVDGDVRERIEAGTQKKDVRQVIHAVEARDLVHDDKVPVQLGLLYLLGQIGRVRVVVDRIVAAADPDKAEPRG